MDWRRSLSRRLSSSSFWASFACTSISICLSSASSRSISFSLSVAPCSLFAFSFFVLALVLVFFVLVFFFSPSSSSFVLVFFSFLLSRLSVPLRCFLVFLVLVDGASRSPPRGDVSGVDEADDAGDADDDDDAESDVRGERGLMLVAIDSPEAVVGGTMVEPHLADGALAADDPEGVDADDARLVMEAEDVGEGVGDGLLTRCLSCANLTLGTASDLCAPKM
jgi:hypothetical protein